jgi:hypothetical protein
LTSQTSPISPAPVVVRCAHRVFLFFICLTALCGSVYAQTEKTVTIRMIDTKTGILIASSNYLVRINHQETQHGDWTKKNEDGSGKLTLPADADVIAVHATYDGATFIYVNCDADKDRGSADHAPNPDRWYSIATILTSGIVAPNSCIGKKVPEKLQVIAKPGEFVFFVRELNSMEKLRE